MPSIVAGSIKRFRCSKQDCRWGVRLKSYLLPLQCEVVWLYALSGHVYTGR